jgi:UDP-N-acetylglucosamine 3-dehydrogenase
MPNLRVGLVGLGHNGLAHAHVWRHHEHADLVGLCDLNPARTQQAHEALGAAESCARYTSLDEMLKHAQLDVLSVNTSDHLHAEPFVKGLRAGCHVLVEKPMGNTLDDLYAMTEAARLSDRKMMVGQILRFNPYNKEVHRLCASGELGEIFYLEADYLHGLKTQADPSRLNPYTGNLNWYLEHEKVLVGGCSHQFDLLRWYAGSYAVEVMGYGNSVAFPAMKHPDCMCAVVKLASGAVCKLTGAYGIVGPRPDFNNLEVYGTAGTVRGGKVWRGEGDEAQVQDISATQITGHPYEPEIDHFIDCILNDRPPLVDAFEGANSAAAMIVATEAVETGKVLPVPHFVR